MERAELLEMLGEEEAAARALHRAPNGYPFDTDIHNRHAEL